MANLNHILTLSKQWYLERSTRERFYLALLSFALLYALLQLLLFMPLKKSIQQSKANKLSFIEKKEQLNNKIQALHRLSKTPIYLEWIKQNKTLAGMKTQYKTILQAFDPTIWNNILKVILDQNENIRLINIKILPEINYKPDANIIFQKPIFEQPMQITMISTYFETINFINQLRNLLPNIYWNKFTYKVLQYPHAEVEMEFSIFYEKQTI